MATHNKTNAKAQAHPKRFVSEATIYEVVYSISQIKNNEAGGSDRISAELFKHGGNTLTMEITKNYAEGYTEEYQWRFRNDQSTKIFGGRYRVQQGFQYKKMADL